ncbi:MAG: hypothetical protein K2L45_07695 [Muribaculaceae bacterium]|nr:hypothetical protein [Muribaculaceae bacterium]
MKRFFYFLTAVTMLMTVAACSDNNDDMPDDDFVIWDIYPAGIRLNLVDEEGNNMLDPAVNGNWVGEPMWIETGDKVFDVLWKRNDLSNQTRAYLPHFYGTVWTGIWTDKLYGLYFGELDGDSSHNLKMKFGITAINSVYEFEYSHRLVWENKEPHFDDHITYAGKRIDGDTLTLTVPKNDK